MKDRVRFRGWAIGLGFAACLVGAMFLALRSNLGGIWDASPQSTPVISVSQPSPSPPTTFRHKPRSRRPESYRAKNSSAGATRPEAIAKLDISDSGIPTASAGIIQDAAHVEPPRRILKPLGYVQRANGVVEAIVSEGDGVQVVHVGDRYEDRYTVAQITPNGVELVMPGSTQAESGGDQPLVSTSNRVNGVDSSAWSVAPEKPDAVHERNNPRHDLASQRVKAGPVGPDTTKVSRPGVSPSAYPLPGIQAVNSNPRQDQPVSMGYVEKSDGTRVTVLADGQWVRLQPEVRVKDAPETLVAGAQPSSVVTTPQQLTHLPESQPTLSSDNARNAQTLGYVEKGGKIQAIVNDQDEIRLALTSEPPAMGQPANSDPKRPPNLSDSLSSLQVPSMSSPGLSETNANSQPGIGFEVEGLAQQNSLDARTASPPSQTTADGVPPTRDSNGIPLPDSDFIVADDSALPVRPPPNDATAELTFGVEANADGASDHASDVLGSLGLLNAQDGRASPDATRFVPSAPPTGPPDGTNIASSSGYEDWQYGRASPIVTMPEPSGDPTDPAQPKATVLKPLGYLDWPDGHGLAVIDDGAGGVLLIHEGQVLDGKFKVIKANSNSVEVLELPSVAPKVTRAPKLGSTRDNMALAKSPGGCCPMELDQFSRPMPEPQILGMAIESGAFIRALDSSIPPSVLAASSETSSAQAISKPLKDGREPLHTLRNFGPSNPDLLELLATLP